MSYAKTIIADAIAEAITRGVDHLTRPKKDSTLQSLTSLLSVVPAIVQVLRPPAPVDNDGPKVQGVKCDLAAEEAYLRALFAERHARLLADFVPQLLAASAADALCSDESSLAEEAVEPTNVVLATDEGTSVRTASGES